MTRHLLLAVLASGSLVLSACGGDDDETRPSSSANPSEQSRNDVPNDSAGNPASGGEVDVAMKDIQFQPKDVSVAVGQTVRWTNEEPIQHNAVATEGADFESELFGEGGEFEWKADTPGQVKYVCTVHPGMEGTITVKG